MSAPIPTTDALLEIRDLNFFYGDFRGLTNVSLNIASNKVTAFIGPSGCGKSTLLRVLGGAIGNVIDRIRFGAVADFIDVSRLYFPWVFNVADSAISIGIGLLLIDMLRQDGHERAAKAAEDAA